MSAGAMIQGLMGTGLIQYPDLNLYKAAVLLPKEERPTVPVQMADEKWRAFQGVEASYFDEPASKKYYPKVGRPHITVEKRGQAYKEFGKKPHRLAAVLAHEAAHGRGADEPEAYRKQYDLLLQLGEKDRKFLKAFQDRLSQFETPTVVENKR